LSDHPGVLHDWFNDAVNKLLRPRLGELSLKTTDFSNHQITFTILKDILNNDSTIDPRFMMNHNIMNGDGRFPYYSDQVTTRGADTGCRIVSTILSMHTTFMGLVENRVGISRRHTQHFLSNQRLRN
jgi:hypothetical protein